MVGLDARMTTWQHSTPQTADASERDCLESLHRPRNESFSLGGLFLRLHDYRAGYRGSKKGRSVYLKNSPPRLKLSFRGLCRLSRQSLSEASAVWGVECCHVVMRASCPTLSYQPLPGILVNVFPAHRLTPPAQVGYQRREHNRQRQKDDPFYRHSAQQLQ